MKIKTKAKDFCKSSLIITDIKKNFLRQFIENKYKIGKNNYIKIKNGEYLKLF